MKIFNSIQALKVQLTQDYLSGQKVGFVPTMGALHEGHASLVRRSVAENDKTVVSIFVNPTQFGPNEDLDKYPRTLEADSKILSKEGADYIFAPTANEMYPTEKNEVTFAIQTLDNHLCGAKRKGHFNGVLLVVSKLFNIVNPTRAYFGLKDFQQFSVLSRMVKEMFYDIEIVGCPIIREEDGLALSSRNRYLSDAERQQGLFLNQALIHMKGMAKTTGEVAELKTWVLQSLEKYPLLRLDYFEIVNPETLYPMDAFTPEDKPVALIAAFAGATRLIDNMPLF